MLSIIVQYVVIFFDKVLESGEIWPEMNARLETCTFSTMHPTIQDPFATVLDVLDSLLVVVNSTIHKPTRISPAPCNRQVPISAPVAAPIPQEHRPSRVSQTAKSIPAVYGPRDGQGFRMTSRGGRYTFETLDIQEGRNVLTQVSAILNEHLPPHASNKSKKDSKAGTREGNHAKPPKQWTIAGAIKLVEKQSGPGFMSGVSQATRRAWTNLGASLRNRTSPRRVVDDEKDVLKSRTTTHRKVDGYEKDVKGEGDDGLPTYEEATRENGTRSLIVKEKSRSTERVMPC